MIGTFNGSSPVTSPRSLGLIGYLLVSAVFTASDARSVRAADVGLPDVVSAYQHHRKILTSLLVDYRTKTEPLIDEEVLYKYLHQISNPESNTVVVVKGSKIFVRTTSQIRDMDGFLNRQAKEKGKVPSIDQLTISQIKKGTDALPRKKVEFYLMYDGDALWERSANAVAGGGEGKEHHGYFASKVTKDSTRKFSSTYLDYIGYGLDDPCLADRGRDAQEDRLPEVLEAAPFSVKGDGGTVDGAACVLLESPGFQRLWLDPKLGYAVRKRESLNSTQSLYVVQGSDFSEVVPGVWMPRRVVVKMMGWGKMPAQYHGKPVSQLVMNVDRIEANVPNHEEYFIPKPPPGSYVVNKTIPALSSDLKPIATKAAEGVTYIQPADSTQLNEVIENAQIRAGMRLEDISASGRRRWMVMGSILVLSIAVITTLILRRGHPATKPEG